MGTRPMRFDRRMSDAEALMWTIEKDPALRADFLQLTFLDSAPDFARFRRRMEHAVKAIPRLRQHVLPPPARFAPPEWADDPSFDLDFHVRHLAVPAPGTDRQLLDLAAVLYEDAFDRARPLWQITIVDGLEGGRAALLAKMHHTITDGVGGVRMSMQFIDLARDTADPDPVVEEDDGPSQGEPGLVERFGQAATHNIRRQVGVARRAAGGVVAVARRPDRVPGLATDAVQTVESLVRQLGVTEPAHSPLWTERSLIRRFEKLTVSLDDLKRAAKGLGGTVNDGFVTAVAGGAAAYHRSKGADVEDLRMTMPVNTRDDGSAGGNAFSPSRVLIAAGIEDPVKRFAAVHERLAVTKGERALDLWEPLAGVVNSLPTSVLTRFARQQAQTVDFATSNIRAADFDLYIAGAEILSNHPMGPTAGTAFNATAMSYRGGFDIGLNIDAAAVEDPALLRESIENAFAELIAAAG